MCRKNKQVINCWGIIYSDIEDLKQSKSGGRKEEEKKGERESPIFSS